MKNLILFLFFSIVAFGAQAQTTVECFSGKQYINCTTCAEGDETGYGYGVQFVDGTDTFRIFAPITYKAYELYAGAGRKVMFYGQSQTRSILYKSYFLSQLDVASEDALVSILDDCNGVSGGTGGGGGIECGDVTACVDFAALTPTQIIELSEAIDFNNLTPTQEADLCAKTSITVNAGTTATSTDNANGETIIDCNDVIHFWSDGTNNVNVTAGSAVIEVSVNISSDADNAITQGVDGGVFVDGSQMIPSGGASGDVLETDGLGGYTWVTPSVGNTSTMSTTGTNGFTHDDGTGTTYAVTIDTVDGGAIDTLVFDLGGTLFEVPFVDEFEVATKTVAFNEVVGNDELITLAQDEVFWFAPKDITITSVSYGFETAPTDALPINLNVGTTEFATTIVAADQYEKVSGSVVVTEGTPIRFISAVPTSGNWEGMHITIEYTEN